MLRSAQAFLLLSLLVGTCPALASPTAAAIGALDRGDGWEAGSQGDHGPTAAPLAEVETEQEESDAGSSHAQLHTAPVRSVPPRVARRVRLVIRPTALPEPSFRVSPSRGPPTRR